MLYISFIANYMGIKHAYLNNNGRFILFVSGDDVKIFMKDKYVQQFKDLFWQFYATSDTGVHGLG